MKSSKKISLLAVCVLVGFLSLTMNYEATALDYPTRPIQVVLGFTPGGGADILARAISQKTSEFLGQPVVPEYKPGGGATIAPAYVAKSKPDGYTLWLGSASPAVIAPFLMPNLSYKMDDFDIVCGYAVPSQMLLVKRGGRWKTLPELVADAKNNPGKYSYSTVGTLNISQFLMEAFSKRAGIKLTNIPCSGAAEATTVLIGGHVDLCCMGSSNGLYEGGRLDVLGIFLDKRLKDYPGTPTFVESGYPIVGRALYFLAVPKGTPREIIDKLYDAHKKTFAKYEQEIAATIKKFDLYMSFLSAEEVIKANMAEGKMYYDVAKDLGALEKK